MECALEIARADIEHTELELRMGVHSGPVSAVVDPRNVSLLTQHALYYICLRRFPEALRKLDQVLNITPDDS